MKNLLILLALSFAMLSCEKTEEKPRTTDDGGNMILEDFFITSIAFDHQGNAWIGTSQQGLIKYNSGEKTVYNASNSSMPQEFIWDIAVDSKNNVWIGCDSELVKYDGTTFTIYNSLNTPMPEDWVQSIAIDSRDNVWFSSSRFRKGGLVKYDGSQWTVFTPDNSDLPVNMVRSIVIDKNDNVWIAANEMVTNSHLVRLSGNEWIDYSNTNFGFSPYYLGKIEINSQNIICAIIDYSLSSTFPPQGPQLFIFDGTSSKQINYNSSTGIHSIAIDHKDNIWCGMDKGYAVYDGEKWTSGKAFLKDKHILVMKQAPDNNMWMGTGNGIAIVNEE
ncbi:MAG TPA: two-component regulator propeller domain-containing protein [Prolixibacteraceae bacterium]|nr:two-component regulator propeller domain-containing protein [Prolixibacteraceae bacterium]